MIEGLKITPNFITKKYELELIQNILKESWNTSLSRRTQHYGYTYNYRSREITKDDYLGAMPDWLDKLVDYLVENGKLDRRPDQIIINEYVPGQGISPHIDQPKIFDGHICSLSLGSAVNMIYGRQLTKHTFYVQPCSLLEMAEDARYKWTHTIPAVKVDVVNGLKMPRLTRYSITFRKMILKE